MICLRFVYLYNITVEKLTVLCEWIDFFSVQAAANRNWRERQSDQMRWRVGAGGVNFIITTAASSVHSKENQSISDFTATKLRACFVCFHPLEWTVLSGQAVCCGS